MLLGFCELSCYLPSSARQELSDNNFLDKLAQLFHSHFLHWLRRAFHCCAHLSESIISLTVVAQVLKVIILLCSRARFNDMHHTSPFLYF